MNVQRLYFRPLLVLLLTFSIVLGQLACNTAQLVKLADRVSTSTTKVEPVIQSLVDSGQVPAVVIEHLHRLRDDAKLLADSFRNGTGDALAITARAITFVELLINTDAKLIKDPNKRLLVLSFLAAADIALGEISDELSKKADEHPVLAESAVSSVPNGPSDAATIKAFAKKPRMRARSAVTGRFVSLEYARQHPAETVIERVDK